MRVLKKSYLAMISKSLSMTSKHILGNSIPYSSIGSQEIKCAPIVIFEGILSFYDESIRGLMNLKIFVLTDDDVRLGRRLRRDVMERARTPESVIIQYNMHVKSSYDKFVKPTMKYADVIIPKGRTNEIGISLIVEDINHKLRSIGISPIQPNKPIDCIVEGSIIQAIKKQELKNVLTCNDDEELLNEIIKKLILQKDFIFNKYWLLNRIERG
jgi:hypothetical protein